MEKRLPFAILGFDFGNGGEFLNYHLLAYFKEHKQPIQFTRSRPYHKGDNAHVEQKNWTHVRKFEAISDGLTPKVLEIFVEG
jgi:hypothetical protein